MKILLLEPYYGGSHRRWADELIRHSSHDIQLLTLPAQFWKWRMQGGAVAMARMFRQASPNIDLILATDMMDVSLFRAILYRELQDTPIALYFHENQLTYPQNSRQSHGWQYGFINYASAQAADHIFFNSHFHLDAFYDELPRMLKHFGDYNELETVDELRGRSSVLPLGLNLTQFDAFAPRDKVSSEPPVFLWNHRWDEDKNPRAFFDALMILEQGGYDFYLALAGENERQEPLEFERAKHHFGEKVIQYGYLNRFEDYARLLWEADYIISTANQDFFGISVCEAIYCECIPILPDRLNYPNLIPEDFHNDCLFDDGELANLIMRHLDAKIVPDVQQLKTYVQQFDWENMAVFYDETLEQIIS